MSANATGPDVIKEREAKLNEALEQLAALKRERDQALRRVEAINEQIVEHEEALNYDFADIHVKKRLQETGGKPLVLSLDMAAYAIQGLTGKDENHARIMLEEAGKSVVECDGITVVGGTLHLVCDADEAGLPVRGSDLSIEDAKWRTNAWCAFLTFHDQDVVFHGEDRVCHVVDVDAPELFP